MNAPGRCYEAEVRPGCGIFRQKPVCNNGEPSIIYYAVIRSLKSTYNGPLRPRRYQQDLPFLPLAVAQPPIPHPQSRLA